MPGFDMIDLFGPLELLYFVAANRHLDVKVITPTASAVVVNVPMGNRFNSTFGPALVGTATMEDDDLELDFLLVPGGAAARDPALTYVDEYLARMFPRRVRWLVTVCTGALFAARGGLLDGRRVTTNKNAWQLVTQHGRNVTWVAPARWVHDGNIWSASGVSSPCTSRTVLRSGGIWLTWYQHAGHLRHRPPFRHGEGVLWNGTTRSHYHFDRARSSGTG
jgi:putative intracellular protease/amidase